MRAIRPSSTTPGGPGRYRGGLAIERHLRFRLEHATLQIRSDRRDHPPYRLQGGASGVPSNGRIRRRDGRIESCPAKFLTTVDDGDVLEVRLAGGGGHGIALERDPHVVLADVLEQKMSIQHARDAYAVVISGSPPAIDDVATARLRALRGSGQLSRVNNPTRYC